MPMQWTTPTPIPPAAGAADPAWHFLTAVSAPEDAIVRPLLVTLAMTRQGARELMNARWNRGPGQHRPLLRKIADRLDAIDVDAVEVFLAADRHEFPIVGVEFDVQPDEMPFLGDIAALTRRHDGLWLAPAPLDEIGPLWAAAIVDYERRAIGPVPEPADHIAANAVVMAIIDDGIAIANDRFRRSAGETRVETFVSLRLAGGHVTAHRFEREEIDQLVANAGGDERMVYRMMDLIDPASDRRQPLRFSRSHGTHVLDLMAGDAWRGRPQTPEERPIIAVNVPSEAIEDRSDSLMPASLDRALREVLLAAVRLGIRMSVDPDAPSFPPLVLNLSFGMFAGPCDGMGKNERLLRRFLEIYRALPGAPRCEITVAAGNSFQSRAMANTHLATGEPLTLDWSVLPDDKTSSFVEIWLPERSSGGAEISVTLTPPGGPVSPPSRLGEMIDLSAGGDAAARIYHQEVSRQGGPAVREVVTLAVRPTTGDRPGVVVAPAGIWTLTLTGTPVEGVTVEVDIRTQRDDKVTFRPPRGRQSYFDDPNYRRFDATGRMINDTNGEVGPVTRSRTLNAYASGPEAGGPLLVAGVRRTDLSPALYSTAGPSAGGRPGPTVCAQSEGSPSHIGVLATGTYSGSVAAMRGTSVAAPQAARQIANAIAAGLPSTAGMAPLDPGVRDRLGTHRVDVVVSETEMRRFRV
ncbi:S8/S53 family peptidase [Acuticoccus mangrovi]|uniref:S8 family serine peptidase n=1 Tax=Acuticoccus mangrovi TaxID=2796142 RepID=A0A934IUK2_9HYPH|nr:S8 family serine peptidase [Acuticoccus mangrovi]MBJ3778432.1 S8 family serine peptidase [Acuticoccus mangrovi]